MRPVTLVVSWR